MHGLEAVLLVGTGAGIALTNPPPNRDSGGDDENRDERCGDHSPALSAELGFSDDSPAANAPVGVPDRLEEFGDGF